jgi:hypothetical protein
MPLPTPNSGETNDDFLARCMQDETMLFEYPDEDQRFAICRNQLDKSKQKIFPIEYKLSASQRWRVFDRKRAGYRRKYRKEFRTALNTSINPFYNIIDQVTDIQSLPLYVNQAFNNEGIVNNYENLYTQVGKEFALFDLNNIRKAAGFNYQTKNEQQIYEDLIDEAIASYIASGQLGSSIKIVTDTSKDVLQRILDKVIPEILEQGLGSGAAQTKLRDAIKTDWHRAMRYRTERIVRTETTTASNLGSFEGVSKTGLAKSKSWVSALDERTRREPFNHFHGQTVNINEGFTATGENIMYAGDKSGSAGNIINCRCSQSYSLRAV